MTTKVFSAMKSIAMIGLASVVGAMASHDGQQTQLIPSVGLGFPATVAEGRKLKANNNEGMMSDAERAAMLAGNDQVDAQQNDPTLQRDGETDAQYQQRLALAREQNAPAPVDDEVDDPCVICRDGNAGLVALDCNHKFHEECIRTWLTTRNNRGSLNNSCPMCRAEVNAAKRAELGAQGQPIRGDFSQRGCGTAFLVACKENVSGWFVLMNLLCCAALVYGCMGHDTPRCIIQWIAVVCLGLALLTFLFHWTKRSNEWLRV